MSLEGFEHLKGTVNLLAFTGRRKSGKTTSADYVIELSPDFKKVSFADPLKEMFAKHKNIDRGWLDHNVYKEEYRQEIQEFSEPFLKEDPKFFVKKLLSRLAPGDMVTCDDLRRLVELEAVMYVGGVPYQVWADESARVARGWVRDPITDNHWSETELDLEPTVFRDLGGGRLYNSKTKDHLFYDIKSIMVKHCYY